MAFDSSPETPRDENPSPSGDTDSHIPMGSSADAAESRPKVAEVIPIRPASTTVQPDADDDDPPIPVWMQRANIVMKFLICVWLGMVVSVLPWTPAWTDNSLIMSLPKLRAIATMDFVKGVISGVGLIDIWIGIWEAVHYRDQRPAPRPPIA
jgi:hypothetical protein